MSCTNPLVARSWQIGGKKTGANQETQDTLGGTESFDQMEAVSRYIASSVLTMLE